MSQFARLTDKTTGQHRSVIYFGTRRDNEIITYYSMPDMHWRCHITVDATVCQTASTADMAIITDPYILDRPCVQNHHMITYTTYRRSMLVGIIIGNRLHAINQFRTVTIQCKYAWCADNLSLISTSRPPVSLSTVASTPLPKVLSPSTKMISTFSMKVSFPIS